MNRLWLAMIWLWPGAVGAQQAPSLPDLRPGSVVRIQATTLSGRLEGRFDRYIPDALLISPSDAAPMTVPIDGLTALWVRGNAARTGAIVGGIAGALAGGVLLEVLCEIGASDNGVIGEEGFDAGCLAPGAGVGLLAGGATGAGIGALVPRWRLRFTAPR